MAWTAGGIAVVAVAAACAVPLVLRHALGPYFESDSFRHKIAEETSRGLKVEGDYAPITHDGWDARTPNWRSVGRPGETIARLDADGVSAQFNPWGIFRRVWQLDWVHLDSAVIELRKADPARKVPLEVKPKPWYNFILPQRMYLKVVNVDRADVLWKLHGETVGIRHAALKTTPYGKKDWRFESVGEKGVLELPPAPLLRAFNLSVIITKPYFYVERATFAPTDSDDPGRVHLSGQAGVQPEDQELQFDATLDRMPFAAWLPEGWREKAGGRITGGITFDGEGTELEGSTSSGAVRLDAAFLRRLMVLDQLALFSGNAGFRDLHFERAALDWKWKEPRLDVSDLVIDAPGVIRLEGGMAIEDGKLSGTLFLGLRARDLRWLPKGGTAIFTQERDGYRWATITLSGTAEKPVEDLGPRIRKAILHSPGTMLKLGLKELFHGKPKEDR